MIIPEKEKIILSYLVSEKQIKVFAQLRVDAGEVFEKGVLTDEQITFRMRNRIWFKIYGDLIEPIRKLEMHARHNCLPHNFLALEKLMEEINQLISTPK